MINTSLVSRVTCFWKKCRLCLLQSSSLLTAATVHRCEPVQLLSYFRKLILKSSGDSLFFLSLITFLLMIMFKSLNQKVLFQSSDSNRAVLLIYKCQDEASLRPLVCGKSHNFCTCYLIKFAF